MQTAKSNRTWSLKDWKEYGILKFKLFGGYKKKLPDAKINGNKQMSGASLASEVLLDDDSHINLDVDTKNNHKAIGRRVIEKTCDQTPLGGNNETVAPAHLAITVIDDPPL